MHGFFSFTAVGATNVGSMTLNFDDKLRTNRWRTKTNYVHHRDYTQDIYLRRGEEIGKFRLGSTVVLVFEAPSDFKWQVEPGEKVRMGNPLGYSEQVSDEKIKFSEKASSLASTKQMPECNPDSSEELELESLGDSPSSGSEGDIGNTE